MDISTYALASPSDAQKKTDREQDGLIGHVRTVWLKSHRASRVAWLLTIKRSVPLSVVSYNASGNKTKVVNYDPGKPSNKRTEVYSYDSTGRKTELLVRQGSIITKTIYRYDDEENKIEAVEQVNMGKHVITRSYVSIFDDQGHQIEAGYKDDSGAEMKAFYHYEFDETGKVKTVETYNGEGFLYHKSVYSYDSSGKLNMQVSYGPSGTVYEKRSFTYRIDGRTEEKWVYNNDASLDRRYIYHYDDKENLVEVLGYDAASQLGRTTHAFRYDKLGNWIEKTSQSWDVETREATSKWTEHRVIQYWRPAA